jgi:hypothetical protein
MDFRIIESGDGGDLVLQNGDIQLISEVYNQPYLSHFGGNKITSNKDVDFWGNILFLQPNEQFNSLFESALKTIELSSSGRIKLESAANSDLTYLDGFATATSTVSITSVDHIQLNDIINQENNSNFAYFWDEAKDEII